MTTNPFAKISPNPISSGLRNSAFAAAAVLALAGNASAATYNWNGTASGNWDLTGASGWNTSAGDYPRAADDVARIYKNIDSNRAVTINVADAKVGTLFLQDNQSNFNAHWNVASSDPATNFLTFENTSGNALLDFAVRNGSGAVTVSAPIKLNSDLLIRVDPVVGAAISGVIADGSGPHGITKTGDNILALGAANTYSGTTTVNAGRLRVFADSGLGTAPGSVLADSITLDGGALETRGPGNFAIDPNRGITLGVNGGTWATTTPNNTHVATYNGVITGAGSLTKTFAQALELGGENTFTGGVFIDAGALRLGVGGTIASGAVEMKAGTNLNIRNTGGWVYSGTITGTEVTLASINLNSGTDTELAGAVSNVRINVNSAGTDATISGDISGANTWIDMQDAGSPILRLSGTNTYGGVTDVSDSSTLFINGNNAGASGAVNVGASATLGGTGIVGGAITVTGGGTLAPGQSIGTLVSNSGVAFADNSIFAVEIDSSAPSADTLVSFGATTIGANVALSTTDLAADVLAVGTKFTLIEYSGGSLSGTFAGLAEGDPLTVGANEYTISYSDSMGTAVTLTATGATAYHSWATGNGLTPPDDGFTVDVEKDGIDNGLEFILGGDPNLADTDILPTVSSDATGLVLVYRLADAAAYLNPFVEYGSELTGWTLAEDSDPNITISTGPSVDGISLVTVTIARALAVDDKLFARLAVAQPAH